MSDKPTVVTEEMVASVRDVIATFRRQDGFHLPEQAAAIEAVLEEREWLITRAFCMGVERDQAIAALVFAKADVERLRKACKYVSKRIHSVPSALPPGTDMGLIQTELYNALTETEPKDATP